MQLFNSSEMVGRLNGGSIMVYNTRGIQVQSPVLSPDTPTALTTTKGLLNGPGQNNCFLNCAVQVSNLVYFSKSQASAVFSNTKTIRLSFT